MSDIRADSEARVVATSGADVRGPLLDRPGKKAIDMFICGQGAGGASSALAAPVKYGRGLFHAPRP
jgi:hypothetical protein